LKICQHILISVKIGQNNNYFSRRCRYICLGSLAMLVFITQIAYFLFYRSTEAEQTVFVIEMN
jgi:MFS superfamily sulfate permease-like transporter